jgi:hypothetical protein
MVEPLYRLSMAATNEFNGQNRTQTKKQFLLLLIGVATLIAVPYAMIIW